VWLLRRLAELFGFKFHCVTSALNALTDEALVVAVTFAINQKCYEAHVKRVTPEQKGRAAD
jgi:hypothetical protein